MPPDQVYNLNDFWFTLAGAVTLSPSGITSVCSGDQLELICTLTDPGSNLLEWTITPMSFQARAIQAPTSSDQTTHYMVNSTLFIFSRISAEKQSPLVSRALISPVTSSLNGTVVNCMDVIMMETASAIISVRKLQDGMSAKLT